MSINRLNITLQCLAAVKLSPTWTSPSPPNTPNYTVRLPAEIAARVTLLWPSPFDQASVSLHESTSHLPNPKDWFIHYDSLSQPSGAGFGVGNCRWILTIKKPPGTEGSVLSDDTAKKALTPQDPQLLGIGISLQSQGFGCLLDACVIICANLMLEPELLCLFRLCDWLEIHLAVLG